MEQPGLAPGTILVVDDQQANLDVIARWLAADGHRVVTAVDGMSALAAADEHHPDLVILDIMIPAPSGFEVCQRLKRDPATRHIPVLLMSGLQDPANWKHGLEVGASDFIPKPIQGHDLRARVRQHLEHTRRK